jgi:hypothetical protein
MSIVERYLAEQTDVAIGRVILGSCDSGATGGGESSSVERRELAGRGWRVIDADRVKDHLLRDAYEQGFYDDLLGIELADGHRVMPRELATLVHTESTVIVDTITERCLAAGENIVLEGTFSWPGLGRRLLADLAEVDYQKLTILDVEAPKEITKARALSR